jgi:hypothetical protein
MKRLPVVALVIGIVCLPALAQRTSGHDFNDLIKRYYAAWNTMNPEPSS